MLLHHAGHVVASYGAHCYSKELWNAKQVSLMHVTAITLIGLYTLIHLIHSVHNNVGFDSFIYYCFHFYLPKCNHSPDSYITHNCECNINY